MKLNNYIWINHIGIGTNKPTLFFKDILTNGLMYNITSKNNHTIIIKLGKQIKTLSFNNIRIVNIDNGIRLIGTDALRIGNIMINIIKNRPLDAYKAKGLYEKSTIIKTKEIKK